MSTTRMPLNRRHLLTTACAAAALPSAGALAGCTGAAALREVKFRSLPAALEEMQRLSAAPQLQSATHWSWSKTLAHLAQSIEYSMQGYPQAKSAWFQRTLGAAAFEAFALYGQMRHDLAEPIPGSPALPDAPPLASAMQRLRQASAQFMAWQGPLQPHFAYGALSHAQYEQAHAMHLANHFAAFRAVMQPANAVNMRRTKT